MTPEDRKTMDTMSAKRKKKEQESLPCYSPRGTESFALLSDPYTTRYASATLEATAQ